jgi:hypothetical protein
MARFEAEAAGSGEAEVRPTAERTIGSSGAAARRRAVVQGGTAVVVLAVSTAAMLGRVEPFTSWYYSLAWWPFILLLDALVLALQGHSLLTRDSREFLFIALLSVSIWLIFEAWNLVLENWYYVTVTPSLPGRWVGYTVSFATVVPGIFEATELVGAAGLFKRVRVPRIRVGVGLYIVFWAIGTAFLVLPLVWPDYCFPLIWGGFVFLLEPFNHRFGRGLLREWEQGSLRTFVRLLVGGMICGLAWEAFNFDALTKWVYTVPFFEELKLFEMPLAGFLGFPPFAVECYVMVQFINIFRGGKGWEANDREPPRPSPLAKPVRAAVVGLALVGSLVMFHLMDRHTVASLYPQVEDLAALAPAEAERLQGAGVHRLDLWIERPGAWRETLQKTGMDPEAMNRWRRLAVMAALKGMGTGNVRLLWAAGVRSPGELADQDPDRLAKRLSEIQQEKGWARRQPRAAQVRIWVKAAVKLCRDRTGAVCERGL